MTSRWACPTTGPRCARRPPAFPTCKKCNNNNFAVEIDGPGGPSPGGFLRREASTPAAPARHPLPPTRRSLAPGADADVRQSRPRSLPERDAGPAQRSPPAGASTGRRPRPAAAHSPLYAALVDGNGGSGRADDDQDPFGDDTAETDAPRAPRGRRAREHLRAGMLGGSADTARRRPGVARRCAVELHVAQAPTDEGLAPPARRLPRGRLRRGKWTGHGAGTRLHGRPLSPALHARRNHLRARRFAAGKRRRRRAGAGDRRRRTAAQLRDQRRGQLLVRGRSPAAAANPGAKWER